MPIKFQAQSVSNAKLIEFQTDCFTNDEWKTLRDYAEHVKALDSCSYFKESQGKIISIHFSNDGRMACKDYVPENEKLWAVILKLRPIELNNEPASYNRVTGIIGRRMAHPVIREFLKECRSFFDGKADQQVYTFQAGGRTLNSLEVFADYMNACHYHVDGNRKAAIEAITKNVPLEVLEGVIQVFLNSKMKAVRMIAQFIRTVDMHKDKGAIKLQTN